MRFLISLFFVLLASCGPTPQTDPSKETAQINIGSDPETLDPRKGRDLTERVLANMLFEGLTRENKEGKNELALAEEILVSEDGLCYTFHLKEAYWTNGDKVRPKDFIYAWKTALDPLFASSNAYQLFCIKNAKAIKMGEMDSLSLCAFEVNESTLEVHLETPLPYFTELLSFSIFFPVHEAMDAVNWDLGKSSLISCGPFSLKKWKHNDFIQVIKNNNYWDAEKVKLPALQLVMVSEETEMRMFEQKELDWAGSPLSLLSFDAIESLSSQKALCSHPLLGTAFFRVNIEKAPFNNVNIRKAFALAINREAIVKHIIRGDHSPALRFIPEAMHLQDTPYFKDHDEKEAVFLLAKGLEELGMKKEDFPKVIFSYTSKQRNHLIAQAIQEDLRRVLGLCVELESSESKVYFSKLRQKDYQMALGDWIADFNDPINFLSVFKYKADSTNNTEWENQDYISLLDQSDLAKGSERFEILRRCESILMEEMPIVPLYHRNMLYVKQDYLKDVVVSFLGNLDFKWAYLDNSEKGPI